MWNQGQIGSVGKLTAMFPIEHEWLLVFGKNPKDLNLTVPNKSAGENHNYVRDRQADGSTTKKKAIVIRAARELGTVTNLNCALVRNDVSILHSASFPKELPSTYIAAMTNAGQSVCEPFAGSGTTLVACQNLNRKCYAIEISPDYCAVILERMQTAFPELEIKKIA